MAKDKRNSEDTIVDVQEVYSKTEQYVEDNKNTLLIIAGILVVLFAGYFAVTRLYLEPKTEEGMNLIWKAEYWFEIDSLDRALTGDESYYGFEYVADEYGATKAGNMASYYCGIIYMKKGEYQIAIDYLKSADLDDELAGAVAKGTIGDAFVELGNYGEAQSYYASAISHADNNLTTPLYLKKSGLLYEEQGEYENALENFQRIKDDFANSTQARSIDSYIARVGG